MLQVEGKKVALAGGGHSGTLFSSVCIANITKASGHLGPTVRVQREKGHSFKSFIKVVLKIMFLSKWKKVCESVGGEKRGLFQSLMVFIRVEEAEARSREVHALQRG